MVRERPLRPRPLLLCGIASSMLYAAMNVFVAAAWPGYDAAAQTVSELSAVDAPTRSLWVAWAMLYTLLVTGFGWGVRLVAPNKPLRIAGGLLLVYGITGLFWPFFPMHQRAVLAAGGATVSDTLHIAFTMFTVAIMIATLVMGAAGTGRGFRIYTILTLLALAVFGGLTGTQASLVAKDLPTPYAGLWERINIGVFLLWVVALAVRMLRHGTPRMRVVAP